MGPLIIQEMLILLALIVVNGVFAGAEIAVVAMRPTRVRELAESGSERRCTITSAEASPANSNARLAILPASGPTDPPSRAAPSRGGRTTCPAVALLVRSPAMPPCSSTTMARGTPYCSAVAFVGDDVWVSASEHHFAKTGRIYRRALERAAPLSPVPGLPEWTNGIVDTHCVDVNGSHVALVDRAGNVHLSTDAGRSWTKVPHLAPAPSSVHLLA